MRRRRHARALRRRYGRSSSEAGTRSIDEMVERSKASTMRAPRLSMQEQVELDRKLEAALAELRRARR